MNLAVENSEKTAGGGKVKKTERNERYFSGNDIF